MLETSRKSQVVVIYIVLILGTLAVFWQVRDFDFVNFDDGCYVFENPHVRSGLSLANVVWAFTSGHAFNWHPLTWLSHMLDSHLFGVDPGRMHLVNVFFHIANTLLLFILLKDMTGSILQSAFVAAAFALHPTRVESVAWISQRKDVLSTFFLLLTLYSYRGYSVRPSAARYLLALSFFALGLMSKPMLVTLPFLLLLLDYWPLERFSFQPAASPRGRSRAAAAGVSGYPSAGRLVIEKLPFFVLAAIASVVTFLVQRAGGAVVDIDLMPLDARVSNALVSYVRYIGLMLWPSNLAVLYPLGRDRIAFWQAGASFLLLVAISILAIWFGRQRKYLPVGWFWFVGMLVPVIGLVQVGSQALADRYTYMPYTGLFIIVAWGVSELSAKIAHRKVILWGLAAAIFATLGILAHKQTGYWRDGMTLFTRAIAVTRDNNVAHSNRGNIHAAAGRFEEAAADFRRAIEIKPNYAEAHSNLGNVLGSKGRLQEAMESYMRALRSNPLLAEAHYGMGLIHGKLGRWQEAAEAFGRSVEIRPSNAAGQHNLGVAYGLLGRSDDAIAAHKRALAINPHLASARYNLGIEFGNAGRLQEGIEVFTGLLQSDPRHPGVHRELGIIYSRAGRWQEAAEAFRLALLQDSSDATAHHQLGLAFIQLGRRQEALGALEKAVSINPAYAEARHNLANELAMRGRHDEAAEQYRAALALRPDWPECMNNFALLIIANAGVENYDINEAIRLASRASELQNHRSPLVLGTLAAAYAAAERFDEAVEAATKALELAEAANQRQLASAIRYHLSSYKQGRRYVEPDGDVPPGASP